jgi:cell division protein FtsQ
MGAKRIFQQTRKQENKKLSLRERMPVWLSQRLVGGVILLTVLVAVSILGSWWLLQPDTLPIKRVQVEGQFRYLDQKDVYDALGNLASGGFFNVDVRAVKHAAESLPWVDRASVKRVWPDTLQVEIKEQVPLARWNDNKLINIHGVLFEPPVKSLPDKLPLFSGPTGTEQKVAEQYQDLSKQLASVGLIIEELRLTNRRAWDLRLKNNVALLLGKTASNERLERFVAVYPRVLKEKVLRIESVDLRYTNGFAVRWKETSRG